MHGQSIETPHKLRGIDAAIRMQISIVRPILSRQSFATYFHFDLFAGSGINDKIEGCEPLPGSPMIAATLLEQSQIKYQLIALERDPLPSGLLALKLKHNEHCRVVTTDNRDWLPLLPAVIEQFREKPSRAIGTCLIDPNRPSDVDWTIINETLSKCERIDVIVNFPGTAEKRKRYAAETGIDISYNVLDDLPDLCNRKHWLIRDAAIYGNHQFCLCVGRNKDYGDFRAEGFVKWDSDSGKLIRSRITNNQSDHGAFVQKMSGQKWFGFA